MVSKFYLQDPSTKDTEKEHCFSFLLPSKKKVFGNSNTHQSYGQVCDVIYCHFL